MTWLKLTSPSLSPTLSKCSLNSCHASFLVTLKNTPWEKLQDFLPKNKNLFYPSLLSHTVSSTWNGFLTWLVFQSALTTAFCHPKIVPRQSCSQRMACGIMCPACDSLFGDSQKYWAAVGRHKKQQGPGAQDLQR